MTIVTQVELELFDYIQRYTEKMLRFFENINKVLK